MIVENPATQPHYLSNYFPVKPSLIDKDRTKHGDYFKKPTQYWFVNCVPEQNMVMESLLYVERNTINNVLSIKGQNAKVSRSLIHPQYARWFIQNFVLDAPEAEGFT